MLQTPQCFNCKHFNEDRAKEKDYLYTCKAFPNGIPKEYLDFDESDLFTDDLPKQKLEHNKIVAKQNGTFLFEEK